MQSLILRNLIYTHIHTYKNTVPGTGTHSVVYQETSPGRFTFYCIGCNQYRVLNKYETDEMRQILPQGPDSLRGHGCWEGTQ